MSKENKIYKDKIKVRGSSITVLPNDLQIGEVVDCPMTYYTEFQDIEKYHNKLKERILELEKEKDHTHHFHVGGSSKVRFVHEWGTAESKLINARATAFFCKVSGRNNAVITSSWASISRKHDYLGAHSHNDCVASVVYMLEPGNASSENSLDGRFSIVDPRAPGCCNTEEGRVTMEISPEMKPGSMIIFPSELVHFVHPYTGEEPRITIAWNFNVTE